MTAIKSLISSKVRIELLRILALNPESSFNINELSRLTGFSVRGVERELKNLFSGGIVRREIAGNQHRYELDSKCPIAGEIKSIIAKTVGAADAVKEALKPIRSHIEQAFIYGSFATGDYGNESDIDLFLISEASGAKVAALLAEVQREIGRAVNVSQFARDEYLERKKRKDHFVIRILNEPKIMLIGSEDEP